MSESEPRAACAGEWDLFDSTDLGDHELARMICLDCPLLAECEERRTTEVKSDPRLGPVGTWAGVLHGSNHPPVNSREESSYSPDEAHNAWRAHRRGDRTEWAEVGYRVHERWRKRDARKAA